MKLLIRFLLVLAIVLFIAGCGEDETEVQFADPNLEKEIRIAMKCGLFPECYEQHADPIFPSDLEDLMALQVPFGHISNLSGIENCIGLQILWLEDNQVSDIRPLSGLTNLQQLSLDANQISDIGPLSNLTKLQELGLGGNQISDIGPLSNLTKLQTLYLWGNQISDISPLSSLINLRVLYLDKNQISDISPLSNLTKLSELRLSHNQILDISSLVSNSGIGEGDSVDLRGNPLNDKAYNVHIPALQERGVGVLY